MLLVYVGTCKTSDQPKTKRLENNDARPDRNSQRTELMAHLSYSYLNLFQLVRINFVDGDTGVDCGWVVETFC